MKHLGINLRENDCTHKTVRNWWKKLNTLQTNGKLYLAHGLGKLILLKWPYYPRHIQIQSIFSLVMKIPFFTELEHIVPKFAWKKQKTLNIQSNREREEQSWIYYISWIQTILYKDRIIKALRLVTQCPTLCAPMDCSPPGSSVHGDSPGESTGVSCHALLQGIFPTQGSKQVFCIADGLFTIWATRETIKALCYWYKKIHNPVKQNWEPMHIQWASTKREPRKLNGEKLSNKWCWEIGYSHVKEWN